MENCHNNSLIKDFEKAKDFWIKDDYKGLESLHKEFKEKADKARKDYEPYSEHTKAFILQAKLHFKEDELVLKKRNSPQFKAFMDMYIAFLLVFSLGYLIIGILNLTGVLHSITFGTIILQFIAMIFFLILDFYSKVYVNPWRRYKWPKDKRGSIEAFKNYGAAVDVSFLLHVFQTSMKYIKLIDVLESNLGIDKTNELLNIMKEELNKDE